MTTQAQIDKAKVFCARLAHVPKVLKAQVDDWDNQGSFNIFVWPAATANVHPHYNAGTLYGIVSRLQTIARLDGIIWEWHDSPIREYETISGRKYFKGWNKDAYKISIRVL